MTEIATVRAILHAPQEYIGKEVTLKGWVRTARDVKACAFVELNDGSVVSNLQVVYDAQNENYAAAARLNVGCAIIVTGRVAASPNPKQPVELQAETLALEGACPPDYPLQKKRHTLEYLRTIQHLRPRTNTFHAIFRVRSAAAFAIHQFFQQRGFLYVHTPLITASDAEGAGEMFQVTTLDLNEIPRNEQNQPDYSKDFFGKCANLTVSGQLEGEIFAQAFAKIYTFGPTFRAERSNTARHAAEFWMIEPEIAFADLKDDMDLQEDMIKFVIRAVLETCPDELAFCNRFLDNGLLERLHAVAFEEACGRITYTEAVALLEQHKDQFQFPVYWGCDLQSEHERYLTEEIFKKPVFVTDYPKEIKAFYMRRNDDGKTVAAADLLVPGIGELCGGSQREERLELLEQIIEDAGMDRDNYWWYLELRKYGGTRHAGFGLGFERLIMYLTGAANIRDVLPFPRTVGTAEF